MKDAFAKILTAAALATSACHEGERALFPSVVSPSHVLEETAWITPLAGSCAFSTILNRGSVYDMAIQCVDSKGIYGQYWRGTYQEYDGKGLSFSSPGATSCKVASAGVAIGSAAFKKDGTNLTLSVSGGQMLTLSSAPIPSNYEPPTATTPYEAQTLVPGGLTSYRGCLGEKLSPASFSLMAEPQ